MYRVNFPKTREKLGVDGHSEWVANWYQITFKSSSFIKSSPSAMHELSDILVLPEISSILMKRFVSYNRGLLLFGSFLKLFTIFSFSFFFSFFFGGGVVNVIICRIHKRYFPKN